VHRCRRPIARPFLTGIEVQKARKYGRRQFGAAQASSRHASSSRAEEAARQARRFEGVAEDMQAHSQAGRRHASSANYRQAGQADATGHASEARQGQQEFEERQELRRRRFAGEVCRGQRNAGMKGVSGLKCAWAGRRGFAAPASAQQSSDSAAFWQSPKFRGMARGFEGTRAG
jgi:hypothetical protein